MASMNDFTDALRFIGFTASWSGVDVPVSDADFKARFVLYPYVGWTHGDPIPPPPVAVAHKDYPKLSVVNAAMQSRAQYSGE